MKHLLKIKNNFGQVKVDLYNASTKGLKTLVLYILYAVTAFWLGNSLSSLVWKVTHLNNLKVASPVDFSTVQNSEDKTKTDIVAHMEDGTTKVITVPTKDLDKNYIIEQADKEFYNDGRTVSPKTK